MITEKQYSALQNKKRNIAELIEEFKRIKVKPDKPINQILEKYQSSPIQEGTSLEVLIKRPELSYQVMLELLEASGLAFGCLYTEDSLQQVEIHFKYEGYIRKSLEQAQKMRSYEDKQIPDSINYDCVDNIALEAREKLKKIQPRTIGQASRISGVNPADISVLVVYVEKMNRRM